MKYQISSIFFIAILLTACGGGGGGDNEATDTTAPTLTIPGDTTIAKDSSFDPLVGVTAMDETDGNLTASITVNGSVDPVTPQAYLLTYSVTDTHNNNATKTRTVTVNAPPQFTTAGNAQNPAAGQLYQLTFSALDTNGDTVNYSSSNIPDWLSFTSATTIEGTAPYTVAGTQAPLTITASDGLNSTSTTYTLNINEGTPSSAEAHRLLLQATFGPTEALLTDVQTQGIVGWLDQQLSMDSAYTSNSDNWLTHLERTIDIAQIADPAFDWYVQSFNEAEASYKVARYQLAAWWDNAFGCKKPAHTMIGSDQLRQRVAYALSQIIVTSDSAAPLELRGEGLAHYYDILASNAFGNYQTLLQQIARSPAMGVYLSHMGNSKANLAAGTRPDENFARELMQLFTIGLYKLNIDSSPDRDNNQDTYPDAGTNLVPSYSQIDVEELSKVMTGWDLVGNNTYGRLVNRDGDYTQQMEFTPSEHEDEAAYGGDGLVTILGTSIALNSGSDGSGMDPAIAILFNHQNVAPFISKQLIQRLVTSNPSSDYIARVSRVFNNNGSGVKGDLKAVVRAILLDDEARLSSYYTAQNYGKAKEPLLAFTQLMRAVDVAPLDGWINQTSGTTMTNTYWFPLPAMNIAQGPMRSPSVFNFYNADFIPTDQTFADRGLVGPEYQIQTDQVLVMYNDFINKMLSTFEKNRILFLYSDIPTFAANYNLFNNGLFLTNLDRALAIFEQGMEGDSNGDFASIHSAVTDADGDTPKANGVDAIIDHLDTLLLGNTMTAEYKAALKHYLVSGSPHNLSNNEENAWTTIRDAYRFVAASSLYMIQK